MTEQKKEYQHTIAKEVSYSGIGLHSGKDVLMTLKPAEADTGIVFVRTDLPGRPEIKALPDEQLERPVHWGGFALSPIEFEFWQGRPNRMHDRFLYQHTDNHWIIKRLSP